MLTAERVYVLAADNRWQWEEWCDAQSVPRERIPETKQLAFDAFMQARKLSADVRSSGALLLDEQYASSLVARAMDAGLAVGTPAEKAGAFPLTWAIEPFYFALTGSFVKVLVRFRPDDDELIREAQWEKLKALSVWCRQAAKPLVVEVAVARRNEPEEQFEATGRPSMVAGFIGQSYRRNLVPQFWQIEGAGSADGARMVEEAIAGHPTGRQILLATAVDAAAIDRSFGVAARSGTAVGFAVGRAVLWEPSAAYLLGRTSAAEAVGDIAASYLRLVDIWKRAKMRANH